MTDCIIIGGGLIGMLSARALIRRGYQVTVLERGPFGREASWAGGGILSPLYPWRYAAAVNRLAFASQQQYPQLINEIRDVSGIDPEWRQCGLLMIDIGDLDTAKRWAQQHDVEEQQLTAARAVAKQPGLNVESDHNLFLPDIAQVRNPRFIKAMQTYLQAQGAQLLQDAEVSQIELVNSRVVGVRTVDGRSLSAEHVVIANGAWSGRLLKQMHIDLQIHPVRGQMLLLQARSGLLNTVVLKDGHYLIQRNDGKVVVGSTVEYAGFDKSTTAQALHELQDFAASTVAELAQAPVLEQWAGLRPGCGEGIPYISAHPQIRGLYINAGHFRNGIVMAPASAELLAALLSGETPAIDPEPYALGQPRRQIVI